MAKKIRFPLQMNGVDVRTIEELREHFDLESVLGYFINGKLVTWLRDRYYDNEASIIEVLSSDDTELNQKIMSALGITVDTEIEEIDMETVQRRNEKLMLLRQITDDQEIIDSVDRAAFNQDDLYDILDDGAETVYLCQSEFEVPLTVNNRYYIGLGNPIVKLRQADSVDLDIANIKFKNVHFAEETDAKIIEALLEVDASVLNETIVHSEIKDTQNENFYSGLVAGDTFEFGIFDGKSILWKVLRVNGKSMLCISDEPICSKLIEDNVTGKYPNNWEKCSLRKWLNSEFYNNSFTVDEKVLIAKTSYDHHFYEVRKQLSDYFYLPSEDEVNYYLSQEYTVTYWTRTPYERLDSGAYMKYVELGRISVKATKKQYKTIGVASLGVRPVFTLKY